MADVFTSIAISPSGATLLNALQVTTTAGNVLNEVVSIGDPGNGANYAAVLASGAQLVEPGGVNTQPVTGTLTVVQPTATALNVTVGNFPAAQTVTGTVTIGAPLGQTSMAASIPVVLASNQSAGAFPATQTVAGTMTVVQLTATALNVFATQFTNPWTVSGAVTATLAAASTITVTQGTASNLNATIAQPTAANLNATVVGTVTANAGTNLNTSALALEAGGNLAKVAGVTGSPAATAPTTAVENGLVAATAYPTAVSGGQLVAMMGDKAGRAAVVLNAPRDLISPLVISPFTATGASFGILTAAASSFYDISSLVITSPQTVAATFTLADGVNSYPFNLAPNGGIAQNFPSPLPMGAAAATWTGQLSAVGSVSFIAVYIKNK